MKLLLCTTLVSLSLGASAYRKQEPIVITHFAHFPPEIEGCSCYFAETAKQFEKQELFLAVDLEKFAYISINGKDTRLKLVEPDDEAFSFFDGEKSSYSNGEYTVTIEAKDGESTGEEVYLATGKVTVKRNDGAEKTTTLSGECGC